MSKLNKYKGVVISDVHVGAIDDERLNKEMQDVFIHDIFIDKEIDFIIIDGDWFDRKFYLNEPSTATAMILMEAICRRNVPVRVVYGTSSHEAGQYGVFEHAMTAINPNFRVVYTVEEEELLPGLNVLYIPEEYIDDKRSYYKDYLYDNDEKYDFIFGHGVIQEAMVMAARSTNKQKQTRAKAPVFSSAELANACKGLVFFGHYHVNTNIGDKVFYVGSYSRWVFGEEEPKGYYRFTADVDKEVYGFEFIENIYTEKYTTLHYGYNSKIFHSQEEFMKEMDKIDNLIKQGYYNHVRWDIHFPPNFEATEFMKKTLIARYRDSDTTTMMFSEGENKNGAAPVDAEEDEETKFLKQYDFIEDDSLGIEDKVQKFIEVKDERVIPVEHIRTYMSTDKIEDIVGVSQESENK